MTKTNDWHLEPQPVPVELEPTYVAEPYADPWNSILERLEQADRDKLRLLANGGAGNLP